jgi:hypothetical protein
VIQIAPRSQEAMAERWETHQRARRQARSDERQRTLINYDLALRPSSERHFYFRGRRYVVPPIPWHLGAELADTFSRFGALDDAATDIEVAVLAEKIVRLFQRAARPRGLWARVAYLVRNPFRDITFTEMRAIHSFFLICRTSDEENSRSIAAGPHPSTLQTSSFGSFGSAPGGSGETETLGHGSTSSSGFAPGGYTTPRSRSGRVGRFGPVRRGTGTGRTGNAPTNGNSDGE